MKESCLKCRSWTLNPKHGWYKCHCGDCPAKARDSAQKSVSCGMIKVGDEIKIYKSSSFGDDSMGKVTEITTMYNEHTGKPYKVIWIGDHKFSAKTGRALNPPTAYHISIDNTQPRRGKHLKRKI